MTGGRPQEPSRAAPLRARLRAAPDARLAAMVGDAVEAFDGLARRHGLSRRDFAALIRFLTDVGQACSDRRQEWVLLADALGLSSAVEAINARRPDAATPNTVPGPFWRPGAPLLEQGADIARVPEGAPLDVALAVRDLDVALAVRDLDGRPVAGARVEVWQANGAGLYENQDPDNQPEMNLRGAFLADGEGRVRFRTRRPGGYALPQDGPVGRLMAALGLPPRRPAHLHLRVAAPGFEELVTHVFDSEDPDMGRDALFADDPRLRARFVPDGAGGGGHRLDWTLVLAPARDPTDTTDSKGERP